MTQFPDEQNEKGSFERQPDEFRNWVKVFKPLAKHPVDLFPEDIKDEQAALSQRIYEDVNNGVYEAGFASSQSAYEKAYTELFDTLESLEARLSNGHEYLFGSRIVETDYLLKPNPRPVPHQVAFPSRLISLIGRALGSRLEIRDFITFPRSSRNRPQYPPFLR